MDYIVRYHLKNSNITIGREEEVRADSHKELIQKLRERSNNIAQKLNIQRNYVYYDISDKLTGVKIDRRHLNV